MSFLQSRISNNMDDIFSFDGESRIEPTPRGSFISTCSLLNIKRNNAMNFESRHGSFNFGNVPFGEISNQIFEREPRGSIFQVDDNLNLYFDNKKSPTFQYIPEPVAEQKMSQRSSRRDSDRLLKKSVSIDSDANHTRASNHDLTNSLISEINKQEKKPARRKRRTNKENNQGCSCKKTKCLKLYCECFSAGGFCGAKCGCTDCHNVEELQDLRDLIVQETREKNPLAFKSKYKEISDVSQKLHTRGCNCKKTGCQKNYCECYTAGIGCSPLCKCNDCKNEYPSPLPVEDVLAHKEKVLRKRKKPNYLYEFYFNKYSSLKKTK